MKFTGLLGVSFIFTVLILSTSLPYQAVAQKGGPDFVPGRYIVVLKDGVSPQDVIGDKGIVPDFVYTHALNGFSGPMSPVVLEKLQQDSRVIHIEQDQKMYALGQSLPTGIDRIDAEPSSSPSSYAGLVTVAIIDTGIDYDHEDLNVQKVINCVGKNWRSSSCSESTVDDGNGHGTHVAGTVAALDNDKGVVGVVPGADLWAIKVLNDNGSGYTSWVIAGIDFVTANAESIDVANMSLGGGLSSALNSAVARSFAAGVVYAVAAGNESDDASNHSPASESTAITVSALADSDGKCGAQGGNTSYGADDHLATFSNYGSDVDIAAPGVSIYSTYKGGGYATYSGTSMASPHVAGAAALVIVNNPGFSPAEVSSYLVNNGISQGQACNVNGDGGFTDTSGDSSAEPLLYVGNSVALVEDTTGPTPIISTSESNPTSANPVPFTVDFGEQVKSFDSTDFTLSSGTIENLQTADNQNWSFEVLNANDLETLSVSIDAGKLYDTSDNPNFASNNITIDIDRTLPPQSPDPTTVGVTSVDYSTEGGKNNDRHLNTLVTVKDDLGSPVSGAIVSVTLEHESGTTWPASATTGSNGQILFTLKNAPSGCYEIIIDNVEYGLSWDGLTPSNSKCK